MLHCLSPRANVHRLWVYPTLLITSPGKICAACFLLLTALCIPVLSCTAQETVVPQRLRSVQDLPARYYIDIYAPPHTSIQWAEKMQMQWRDYDFRSMGLQQTTAIPLDENTTIVVFVRKADKLLFRQLNRDQKRSFVGTLPRASIP